MRAKRVPGTHKPERKNKSMTIALGYHCWNGVIVAADTLVVVDQSEAQEGSKLDTWWVPSGSYAVVNASMDANATRDLIASIQDTLQNAVVGDYRALGKLVKNEMRSWSDGFGRRKPPHSPLLLAVKLTGKRAKLFLCEPPNTFVEQDDYKAIGAAASVTDPLYNLLFDNNGGEHTQVQTVLRRIAYLIYRAKKGNIWCGKRTHAAVVSRDDVTPSLVSSLDMENAETASKKLDFLFSAAAIFALQNDDSVLEHNAKGLGDMLKGFGSLRAVIFRDAYGDEITTPSIAQM